MPVADQVAVVYAATNGYLDRIDARPGGGVPRASCVERLHSEAADTLETIADGDWSDETQKALDEAIAEFAEDFGYDLDEEGQPLDEDAIEVEPQGPRRVDERRRRRRRRRARSAEEEPAGAGCRDE